LIPSILNSIVDNPAGSSAVHEHPHGYATAVIHDHDHDPPVPFTQW